MLPWLVLISENAINLQVFFPLFGTFKLFDWFWVLLWTIAIEKKCWKSSYYEFKLSLFSNDN